jgi:hypothetical protein
MVETELVAEDIENGKRAVEAVESIAEPDDVRAAFWLYDADASEWRLVFALRTVDRLGPEAGYKLVQRALTSAKIDLPLRQTTVVKSIDSLVTGIHRELGNVGTSGNGTTTARLGRRFIDGQLIKGAYVYKST